MHIDQDRIVVEIVVTQPTRAPRHARRRRDRKPIHRRAHMRGRWHAEPVVPIPSAFSIARTAPATVARSIARLIAFDNARAAPANGNVTDGAATRSMRGPVASLMTVM
jgi:hypothetical protein